MRKSKLQRFYSVNTAASPDMSPLRGERAIRKLHDALFEFVEQRAPRDATGDFLRLPPAELGAWSIRLLSDPLPSGVEAAHMHGGLWRLILGDGEVPSLCEAVLSPDGRPPLPLSELRAALSVSRAEFARALKASSRSAAA